MAISQLSLVTIIGPKTELEELIIQLYEFQEFHPNEDPPFYEEFILTQLKSRSVDLHMQCNSIIENLQEQRRYDFRPFVEKSDKVQVNAASWTDLINRATNEIMKIRSKLSCKIRLTKSDLSNLVILRETTFIISNILTRIKIRYRLKFFVTIQGYIPTKSEDRFKENFHKWYCHIRPIKKERIERTEVNGLASSSPPSIPTRLENPKFMKMFENVTLAQGIPRYNEIDPTPIIAFVFPFFYGIMFADLGQGLVLIAFGSLLSLRRELKRRYRYWGKMLISFGISASIFGLLTGSFFGLELSNYGIDCCPLSIPNLRVFEPSDGGGIAEINIDAIMTIMMIVIVIGTFHLSIAYIVAILDNIKNKDYAEAFTFHLATLIMYSFGVLFALSFIGAELRINELFTSTNPLPIFWTLLGIYIPSSDGAIISVPVIIASLFTVVFGRALISLFDPSFYNRKTKYRLMLDQGVIDIAFIPIVFLTNTISYARLGIFLIIHSALMGLVNTSWSFGILGLPTIILGNIAVMVMEGFLVYIQDLRLHLYEWLTKFAEGIGENRLFTPMRSKIELVDIVFTSGDKIGNKNILDEYVADNKHVLLSNQDMATR